MIPKKYKIRRLDEKDLKPEETLADALSEHAVIEVPIGREVFRVLWLILALMAAMLIPKAFELQIFKGKHFAQVAARVRSQKLFAPPLRGIIYDAQGRPLVENLPIFDLVAVHADLPASVGEVENLVAQLAPVINVSFDNLLGAFRDNFGSATFVIKHNLSKEEAVKIKVLSPAGVYVVANSQRRYLKGPALAPIVGYTAKVGQEDLADFYYLLTDRIGRLGLEQFYEKTLRGDHRPLVLPEVEVRYQDQPRVGSDLVLNINGEIQDRLYQAMVNVLSPFGLKRGAAVVQDPDTGQILALVSLPSFDNNLFESSPGEADLEKITKVLGDKNKPLFNRVVSGRYSPGSTIKPLLAMAGLKEGVVTPETAIYAGGSISVKSKYDPDVSFVFKDWKIHGWTDLKKAIADSVDVYFYALGGGYGSIDGLGDLKITGYLRDLGADRTLGIDLPGEVSGFVPSREQKLSSRGEPWFVGDTYNISIGQGDLAVTPLWLNSYIGAVANGGRLMKPYLVKEIKNGNGVIISQNQPQVLTELPFDASTIGAVRNAMRQAVVSGTAALLRDLPVPVAAKTGTAQVTGRGLNSLFVVFGPYDNPTVAMTVLVENTQGQGLATRIAHDFLKWYFTK